MERILVYIERAAFTQTFQDHKMIITCGRSGLERLRGLAPDKIYVVDLENIPEEIIVLKIYKNIEIKEL